MTLQQRPTTIASPIVTCSICGREIHPDSASIPIWGKVGGHCKSRLAAMTATLEREGLGEFLNGPVQFDPIESEDANGNPITVYPNHIQRLTNRARRLGLQVVHSWPRMDGPATLELRLPHGDKARKRLMERFEQVGVMA